MADHNQSAADTRRVVVCNERGEVLGTCALEEAHRSPGRLHLAFSVFVFRRGGEELLIQQRHPSKLFGSLWANTCCSHPRPGQSELVAAAERRLQEECGFSVPLTAVGTFVYQAEDPGHRGAEHEFDTVLVGEAGGEVHVEVDPHEVVAWKWVSVVDVQSELEQHPERFAPWFSPAFQLARAAGR